MGSCEETKISAVICDLDGTLLNSEMATKGIVEKFLGKYGKVMRTDGENGRLGKTQKESAIAIVRDYELPLSPEQFIEEITPLFKAKWAEAKTLPGWEECFSVILGSDQVKSGKPAPDLFLEAARRLGVDAADCLVIEDSMVGVKAAKAAGMRVLAVPSLSEADAASLADAVHHSLLDFQPEYWGLPPFDDGNYGVESGLSQEES